MWTRFKHWFINTFWYHYRWPTLAVLAVIALIVGLIVSVATNVKSDFSVVMATQQYADPAAVTKLEELIGERFGDVNGDGKLSNEIQSLVMTNDEMGMAAIQKLTTLYITPEYGVYIYDESQYLRFSENGLYIDLSEHGFETAKGMPWLVDVGDCPVIRRLFPYSEVSFYAAVRILGGKDQEKPALIENQRLSIEFVRILLETP